MTPRTMLDGYLAAALDTETTEGRGAEIRLSELFTAADFDRESIVKAEAACQAFRRQADALLLEEVGLTEEQAGRYLWIFGQRIGAHAVVRCRDYLHLVGN